jgi:hypothetical protein
LYKKGLDFGVAVKMRSQGTIFISDKGKYEETELNEALDRLYLVGIHKTF